MQHLFFTWKKTLLLFAVAAFLPGFSRAQNSDPMFDQMQQMIQRLQEQMRRGMPVDTSFQGGHLQYSPDSSSYFYYHIDTSFNGIGGSQFFQFGDPGPGGMPDMNSLMQQFFNMPFGQQFDQPGQGDFPADDGGQQGSNEDELLPEERLRLQEEHPDQKQPGHEKKAEPRPEKSAKSTVKKIRI